MTTLRGSAAASQTSQEKPGDTPIAAMRNQTIVAKKKVSQSGAKKKTQTATISRSRAAAKKKASKKRVAAAKPIRKAAAKKPVTKKAKTTASAKKTATRKAPSEKAPVKKTTARKRSTSTRAAAKKTTAKKPASASKKKTVSIKKKPAASAAKKTAKKARSRAAAKAKPAPATLSNNKPSLTAARAAAKRLAAAAGLQPVRVAEAPDTQDVQPTKKLTKSPLNKRELRRFRDLLLNKRMEVVGDVSAMESEALSNSDSGALSSMPQHMADQGSDEYDQSLALDLAASQRKLLLEIDDAIDRIEKGFFGVCELLGSPIQKERLDAKPWARYSVEGAMQLDRQMYQR